MCRSAVKIVKRSWGSGPPARAGLCGLGLLLVATLSAGEAPAACPPGGTALRWETFAEPLLTTACNPCHAWNNYSSVWFYRDIIASLVASGSMPPNGLPARDRSRLAEWIACGLPLDGPTCPDGGTEVTWDNFAGEFLIDQCGSCHSRFLEGEDRQGAPLDQSWDDPAHVRNHATGIRESILRGQMPPDFVVLPSDDVARLVEWIACDLPGLPSGPSYRRADVNLDGSRDLTDAISILRYLFSGGAEPTCLDAADIDANGKLEISDAVEWLEHLYLGALPPPEPFVFCGSFSRLGCGAYPGC